MNNPNNDEFLKFLQERKDQTRSVQNDVSKNLTEKRILNIEHKRDFFQHITLLALGISGISFFTGKVIHEVDFYLGFSVLLLVVLIILVWFRETLDLEQKGLQSLQDKYSLASEEIDNLITEFAQGKYTSTPQEYFTRVQNLPYNLKIKKDAEEENGLRGKRDNLPLDYFGEFIIFLFFSGIVFLFLSIIKYDVSWYLQFFLVLFVFGISTQDIIVKKSGLISKFISFLHYKI